MDHGDGLILKDDGQDLVLLPIILFVNELLHVSWLLVVQGQDNGPCSPWSLGPSHQATTKADVVVLEVSVVSDNEPRVGEKHDQGQGRGGEHEEGG